MEKLMYYLDNAATTRVSDEVFDVVKKYQCEQYYNPSSLYLNSVNVRKDIEKARQDILEILGASKYKLFFTSCATESTNTVFNSLYFKAGDKVIVSAGEHPSVYNSAMKLKNKGVIVEVVKLTKDGQVDVYDLENKVDDKVKLVCVMLVSNETGAINDIYSIARIVKAKNKNALILCDGVQGFGKIKICLDNLNVDYFVLSGHKIHAPKGIGALVVKKDAGINPLLVGGGQENGLRSGTENVSGIMGLHKAAQIANKNLDDNYKKVLNIKKEVINQLLKANLGIVINGEKASPYVLSISIPSIRGEVLLHMLEEDDVLVATGSACSSKNSDNRILSAMGKTKEEVLGNIRISFNAIDDYDVQYICRAIIKRITELKGRMN